MLIGLSVSLCIRDIADRKIDPSQVAYIVGSINPTFYEEDPEVGIEAIIEKYNKMYWRNSPNAERIFRSLWEQGQVLCPRMKNDNRILMITDGHWLACEQVDRVEEYFGEPEWL